MARVIRSAIKVPASARVPEVTSFFAQLDELSGRMFKALARAKPAELAWQPRTGMNTIGMLLAHDAIVEAFWIQLATGAKSAKDADAEMLRAIGVADSLDGMPLPAGAKPPRALKSWTMARYKQLHDRARKFAKGRAKKLRRADLGRELKLVRPNGDLRVVSPRWILYHVLEHQAGHFGQMLLLRHQYRERRAAR